MSTLRTPLDGLVLLVILVVVVVSIAVGLVLELRDHRRRRAYQRSLAARLGLIRMPRPPRRVRRGRGW